MMIVGITGGIGSGKTMVCNIFRQLGIPVYEADVSAKKLYDAEPELLDRIKSDVSENVFDKKGNLVRQIRGFSPTRSPQLLRAGIDEALSS